MTRHVRSWALAALAVFALAGAATPSLAGIVYDVTNDLTHQNGWSLAGTITVSGTGTFTTGSAITAWDLTATKSGSASQLFNNRNASQSSVTFFGTGLTATPTTLSLLGSSGLLLRGPTGMQFVNYNNFAGNNDYSALQGFNYFWNSNAFSPTVAGARILGTATPSAVPEIDPAMGGSALSLVAGVLAMIEQRRRRAMRVA